MNSAAVDRVKDGSIPSVPIMSKVKGEKAEAVVISELVKHEIPVLTPFGDNQPYDLVIEKGGDFQKVQVKSSTMYEGCVRSHLQRTNMTADGTNRSSYDESEVDLFSIYSPEQDEVYWVPFDDAPETAIQLRIDDNIDPRIEHTVRWAEDYNTKEFVA